MKQSKYFTGLQQLIKTPVFMANDARKLGIPSRMLSYYCELGHFERISRGIYRGTESESGLDLSFEDLILTAYSIPRGVICLISALCFYGMTDQIMREYWIAVPNSDKSPIRPFARIIRMRNMTLGLSQVRLGEFDVKIFDRERTVVDAFRYLSHEIAIKALQAYLRPTSLYKTDLVKLSKYAKAMKINVTPYLMALTT